MKKVLIYTFAHLILTQTATAADVVAGARPEQRPAQAPVIQQYAKSPAWYAQALRGVYPPYPRSLGFLDAQGAWYTPFTRPGMAAPYDLRGWHTE